MLSLSLPRPCLMLVTEPMERSRLVDVLCEAVAGGVNAVQLRDKTASPRDLMQTAVHLKLYLGETVLIVNGCLWAARQANASGVQLPEGGTRTDTARTRVGPDRLIGRSVHSVDGALAAAREGADYLIAGTIFESRSHPGAVPGGTGFLHSICAAVSVPVIAIGGVTAENTAQCAAAGAAGVAVLSAILHSADPRAAAARYRAVLGALQRE